MKLTNKTYVKATKSGMTLLELTVVILVLLSLISILFIGARAWKRGSDRAASILTIRNVQQAVRSYANMNGKNPTEEVTGLKDQIFGEGKFIENDPTAEGAPPHPAGGDLAYVIDAADVIPDVGILYMEVSGTNAADYMPETDDISDW